MADSELAKSYNIRMHSLVHSFAMKRKYDLRIIWQSYYGKEFHLNKFLNSSGNHHTVVRQGQLEQRAVTPYKSKCSNLNL